MLEKKVIGQYRIVEKLGQGGMGAVYKAWDQKRKRFVAIKVLTETVDRTYFDLFEREIQLLANLDHPNIVPVYDVGWYINVPFFVMGYLEGRSLLDVIMLHQKRRKGFALPFFFAVFRDVAQALHHAHSKDIFHRDLKPENILISPRKRAFLLDFGLAKLLHDRRIVPENYILGTPQYMAPEQIRNKEVDARSDIYSLGLVMYVCLTGRLPFMDRDGMKGARRRLREEFPPPSHRNPAVPPEVDDIVMRCVARKPADRFQLVSDVTLALGRAIGTHAPQEDERNLVAPLLSSPSKLGPKEEPSPPPGQVRPSPLPFTRKPGQAEARLDELVTMLKSACMQGLTGSDPLERSLVSLTPAEARDFPDYFGAFSERSQALRFLRFDLMGKASMFVGFKAVLLKGELHVMVAFVREGREGPDSRRFELDLAGWAGDREADWPEIFRGLCARFREWASATFAGTGALRY